MAMSFACLAQTGWSAVSMTSQFVSPDALELNFSGMLSGLAPNEDQRPELLRFTFGEAEAGGGNIFEPSVFMDLNKPYDAVLFEEDLAPEVFRVYSVALQPPNAEPKVFQCQVHVLFAGPLTLGDDMTGRLTIHFPVGSLVRIPETISLHWGELTTDVSVSPVTLINSGPVQGPIFIPEPQSVLLGLFALAGLGLRRKRDFR